MAPIVRELENRHVPMSLVLTGQHDESMEALIRDFAIRSPWQRWHVGPDVTRMGQMGRWFVTTLARVYMHRKRYFPAITGDPRRHVVVVHGDTLSTLLGAMLGRLLRMTVAHVEAGLRSFDWRQPFPEELTRLAVFRLAHIAFCPGHWACTNVRGYPMEIVDTGCNTIVDALRYALETDNAAAVQKHGSYAVVSIHRFENIFRAARLHEIVSLLESVATCCRLVLVLHPPTRARLSGSGLLERLEHNPNLHLQGRMEYTRFIRLLAGARFVITDGGSNQEELAYLGVPTLLMRRVTERQEGLGESVLIGGYDSALLRNFAEEPHRYARPPTWMKMKSPSQRIVDWLSRYA